MELGQLKNQFEKFYGNNGKEILSFFAPGRVNLIGEHIDYNGGFVFPAALTLGITALWRSTQDGIITLRSLNAEGEVKVKINDPIEYDKKDGWANYPKGVFNHLKKEGHSIIGGEVLFSSNLPDGAGLSSSAAIEVITAYMMLKVAGASTVDLVWLARLCQKVENQYVGVNSGIMDQFSVANGKKNQAILLDCETLHFKYIPFEMQKYALIVMNTNKRRELADSKYNERRSECDQVLALLNKNNSYKNLCEASLEEVDKIVSDLILKKRAYHVITENGRVLKSVEVLQKGELTEFGRLLNASHASLKNDYEVTGIELDTIVKEAQQFQGCLGARMTGAGFGGCAIAIVETGLVDQFIKKVGASYTRQIGLQPEFYVSSIGDGVHQLV